MYKNQELLKPPGYQPTEKEIQLAKANHVMKNYLYGMLEHFSAFYEMQTQGKEPSYGTKERWLELADNDYKKWKSVKANWKNGSLFDAFMKEEDFQEYFVKGLSSMHLGDCTSFPMTCDRCYSESLFQLDYSATWSQKEGAKLLDEFLKDYEEKTGEKYSMEE